MNKSIESFDDGDTRVAPEGEFKAWDESFHEVGCRKCGKGGEWRIFTNGEGEFKAIHSCGHISDFQLAKKPDVQTIDARLVT